MLVITRKRPTFLGAFACVLIAALGVAMSAHAQTYTVLHTFTNSADGAAPYAGLTMDRTGNFYGTTEYGGNDGNECANQRGCGIVFKLTPSNGAWTYTSLHDFAGGGDGGLPVGDVSLGCERQSLRHGEPGRSKPV